MIFKTILVGVLISSAQVQTEGTKEDLECTKKLEAITALSKLFATNPIDGGVYVEDAKAKVSNLEAVLVASADALEAYRLKVCELSESLSKTSFLLSANAACSLFALSLSQYQFQSKKVQAAFNEALTQLAGPAAEGKKWDDCPGFDPEELKKPRVKKP